MMQGLTEQDIERLFTYHYPKNDQSERYEQIGTETKKLALLIKQLTPTSPEQTLALRALIEARMLAAMAIAVNE